MDSLEPTLDFREPPTDFLEPVLAFLEPLTDLGALTVFREIPVLFLEPPLASADRRVLLRDTLLLLREPARRPDAGDVGDHQAKRFATSFRTRSTSAGVAPYFSAVSGTLRVRPPRMMSFSGIVLTIVPRRRERSGADCVPDCMCLSSSTSIS